MVTSRLIRLTIKTMARQVIQLSQEFGTLWIAFGEEKCVLLTGNKIANGYVIIHNEYI
jgi:hypothetical protein